MNEIRKKHIRVVFWLIGAFIFCIFAVWLIEFLFGFVIPSQLLLIAIAGCLAVDAYIRIDFWKNRDNYLTEEELKSKEIHVFLMPIPAEILLLLILSISTFSGM